MGEPGHDAKWQRALLKKLRQLEDLKTRRELTARHTHLALDPQQLQKLRGEPQLLKQLKEAQVTPNAIAVVRDEARKEAMKKILHSQRPTKASGVASYGSENTVRKQISQAQSPARLLQYLHRRLRSVSADCLCHGLHTLAKKSASQPQQDDDLLQLLQEAGTPLLQRLREEALAFALKGRQVSKAMWAATRLRQLYAHPHTQAFDGALVQLSQALQRCLLEDLARGTRQTGPSSSATSCGSRIDAQGVATVLWCLATQATLIAGKGQPQAPGMTPLTRRCLVALEREFVDMLQNTKACADADAIAATMGQAMNAQDVANSVWAFAKLRWVPADRPAFTMAVHQSLPVIHMQLKGKEISMLLWGLASLGETPSGDAWKALTAAVQQNMRALAPQGVANILWALAKFQQLADGDERPPTESVSKLAMSLQSKAISMYHRMTPQGVANSLWAAAQLYPSHLVHKTLGADVEKALQNNELVVELTPQDAGDIAWALGKLSTLCSSETFAPIRKRCLHFVERMNWQGLGHVEYAMLQFYGIRAQPTVNGEHHPTTTAIRAQECSADWDALCRASSLLRLAVNQEVKQREEAVANAIRDCSDSGTAIEELRGARQTTKSAQNQNVLIVAERLCGATVQEASKYLFENALGGKGKTKAVNIHVWSRFCGGGIRGSARIPVEVATCVGVVICMPANKTSLGATLAMLTCQIQKELPILVCGHQREAGEIRVALKAVAPYLIPQSPTRASSMESKESYAFFCRHATGRKKTDKGLKMTRQKLQLEPPVVPSPTTLNWYVYPGLFAAGLLDIMSAYMLKSLPTIPKHARVLDYCSGSGVIAAAMMMKEPSIHVHLLDADSLAIRAAKRNIGGVEERIRDMSLQSESEGLAASASTSKFLLSDSWSEIEQRATKVKYDWIVSNPPVHSGTCDDFTVLSSLLSGARKRLRADGYLWIVAQTYVPVACMATELAQSMTVTMYASNGRFSLWQLSCVQPSVRDQTRGKRKQLKAGSMVSLSTPTKRQRRQVP